MTAPDRIRIVSARALTANQLALLHAATPRAEITQLAGGTNAEIERALTSEVEVLFTGPGDFSITHAVGLKWVQTEAAGVDHLLGTEIWHSAIMLTSANGAHTPHMPEFVLGVMLAHMHKLPLTIEYQRRRVWGSGEHRSLFTPNELHGRTLGIIGYGAIGREIARLAKAFGMRVLATRRSASSSPQYAGYTAPGTGDPTGALPDQYFTLDHLHELLGQSEIVVLVVPLYAGTRNLIGAAELAAMQPDALLINIGRGGLIDQAALIDALQRQAISGAVLDVTDPEPLPFDHPLWGTAGVWITPHIAGLSAAYSDNVVRIFAENLRRYANGEPLLNLVSRDLGY